jgi:hypothetical protein
MHKKKGEVVRRMLHLTLNPSPEGEGLFPSGRWMLSISETWRWNVALLKGYDDLNSTRMNPMNDFSSP